MEPIYSFGLISDVHIDEETWGKAPNCWWKYAEQHFEQCLKFNTEKNVDFIVSAGDQVTNAKYYNLDNEWKTYHYILSNSDYCNPIYESCGNHEIREVGFTKEQLEKFIFETGLTSDMEYLKQGKPYFSFTEPRTGDLFIMMALEKGYMTAEYEEFTDEQLDYVEALLEANYNKGKNIFLIQHALIKGYGTGDDIDNPYYGGALNPTLESTKRFIRLLEKYKDIIWVSGHSHTDFMEGFNYSNHDGASCRMIHASSVANPNHIVNGKIDYTFDEKLSQGYLVNVFENKIEFIPVNYSTEEYYEDLIITIDGNTRISNLKTEKTVEIGADINPSELRSTMRNANTYLGINYEYSSYNQYQHLKKMYYNFKNINYDSISQNELNHIFYCIKAAIENLSKTISEIKDIHRLNQEK